jgi:hypothetical protein
MEVLKMTSSSLPRKKEPLRIAKQIINEPANIGKTTSIVNQGKNHSFLKLAFLS